MLTRRYFVDSLLSSSEVGLLIWMSSSIDLLREVVSAVPNVVKESKLKDLRSKVE
jgi:hypothetical protein